MFNRICGFRNVNDFLGGKLKMVKYKLSLTNFTDSIRGVDFVNSIAEVDETDPDQVRRIFLINKQGDFQVERIEEPKAKEDKPEHNGLQRGGNVRKDNTVSSTNNKRGRGSRRSKK